MTIIYLIWLMKKIILEKGQIMKLMKSRKGLTLIELLIVVIILGALAAIAIPRMSQNSTTAKERACATNRATINAQVELYHANSSSGTWPTFPDLLTDANYFPEEPLCPDQTTPGVYQEYGADHRIECTVHGH